MIAKASVLCFLLVLVASTHAAETGGNETVPFWDMVPVVSQIKSIVQLLTGDLDGSAQTGINFFDKGIVSSQLQSLFQLIQGNVDKAVEIQKEFGKNIKGMADSLPIVGHVKGAIHLLKGEEENGWSAIKQATSSAFSVLGGLVAGPIGALTGQVAADGAISVVDMAVNDKAKPHGLFDYVMTIKDRKVGEHVDALAGVLTRGIAGGSVKPLKQEPQASSQGPGAAQNSSAQNSSAQNSSAQNSSDDLNAKP